MLGSQGKLMLGFTKRVHKFCEANAGHPQLQRYVEQVAGLNRDLGEITKGIGMAAMKNPDEVGAASVDYLMYCGYLVLGYFWLRMAVVAQSRLEQAGHDAAFYQSKLATAEFYFTRLLPRTAAHRAAIEAGSASLMKLAADQFAF